jgi:hypothetical protein
MAYNIRPLSFAELLDLSFQVLRDNFVLLVGISLVVWLPYGVLTEFASPRSIATSVVLLVALTALVPLGNAAVLSAIADAYLDRPTTVQSAYRTVLPIFVPFIGTWIVLELLIAVGILLLVVPGLYFGVCWALVLPVMVVERRFGFNALSRSRALVRGKWWVTLGIVLVSYFVAEIPVWALGLLWIQIPILGKLLSAATSAAALTYPTIVLVVYYFDRRCRLEDFDLRLLAEHIRAEGAPGAAAVAPASTVG